MSFLGQIIDLLSFVCVYNPHPHDFDDDYLETYVSADTVTDSQNQIYIRDVSSL